MRGLVLSRRLKLALVTEFFDGYAPHFIRFPDAVRQPSIVPIEALCAHVARENPQDGLAKSSFDKMRAGRRYKSYSYTPAPTIGIYIKRAQFAMRGQVHFPRWHGSGESEDRSCLLGNDGSRLCRIDGREIVSLCPVLGAQLIQIRNRKQFPVGHLPRPHVYARNSHCIFGHGQTDSHGDSIQSWSSARGSTPGTGRRGSGSRRTQWAIPGLS